MDPGSSSSGNKQKHPNLGMKQPKHPKLGKKVPKHIPSEKEKKQLFRMKRLQRADKFMMRKTEFERVVREIGQKIKPGLRWNPHAIQALQVGSEAFLNDRMEKGAAAATHAGRKTTGPSDLKLVEKLSQK